MEQGKVFTFTREEEQLFQKSGIAAIYLFGSQAQGVSGKLSDYDFGILLENPKGFPDRQTHHRVYDALYDIFEPKIGRLVNIDIVFLQEATLQLQFHVIRSGVLLYEGNAKIRADYHEKIMEAHADFAPLREIFHHATLSRI